MKTKLFLSVIFLFVVTVGHSQCDYFMFKANKKITMGIYDKKGGQTGTLVYKISDVKKSGGTTISNYNSEMYDKKGKLLTSSENSVKCDGGKLFMNVQMNMAQTSKFKDVKVKANTNALEFPGSLKVGQTLPDGNLDMDFNMSGIEGNMLMNTYDREVVAKEKITTPAGTWDAYKITSKSKVTMTMTIPIAVPVIETTEWFVPNFGVVKSESKAGGMELLSIE